jgi:predicted small lipoprotein YifL
MRVVVWLALMLPLTLTACGQKGPLVLPSSSTTPMTTPAE